MNKLSTLFAAAKNAPVKTALITTAVVAGTVGTYYGVRAARRALQNRAEGTNEADFTEVKEEETANAEAA